MHILKNDYECQYCQSIFTRKSSLVRHLQTCKKNVTELDPNGGIVYTGNAEVLKQVCPGDFGKINKQGFCMIGSKIK